jgi:hypothetical protein
VTTVAGGGKGRLTEDEIAALVEKRRIPARAKDGATPTPANLHRFLGPIGHDAINRWILVAARAKRLGCDTPCGDCYGEGNIRTSATKLEINLWTADPVRGSTQVDWIRSVRLDEFPEVREHLAQLGLDSFRERFGWALGSNMHPEPLLENRDAAWGPGRAGMANMRGT